VRVVSLPDDYIDHAERGRQLAAAGLDADSVFAVAYKLVSGKLGSARAKPSKRLVK